MALREVAQQLSEEGTEDAETGTGTAAYPYRREIRSSPYNIPIPGGIRGQI